MRTLRQMASELAYPKLTPDVDACATMHHPTSY
jgi:hypothetical protein